MGSQHICLPFASEAQYREYVDDPAQYRQYLSAMVRQYPELFPQDMDQGFTFHDAYASVKQDVIVRRIKVKTTGAVFALRPSFVMPSMIGRTDAIEKALSLRQWGVPFDALASVFGRDALFWYRAWLAFGRPSLVGTTVKDPHQVPRDLVADEQLTQVAKQQVYVPTTVGGGCFLGVSVVEAADTVTLERGYGALCEGSQGARSHVSRTLGLHRWVGSDAPGMASAVSQDHGGAVFSPRDPEDAATLRRPVAPPETRQGLAGLSSRHQTAVCPASAAPGRVDAVAPQRASGHNGVAEVSTSGRLHPRLCVSAGASHLQCGRSADQRPRPATLCHALLARHHQECAPRRTCDGAAMELSPVWRTSAA